MTADEAIQIVRKFCERVCPQNYSDIMAMVGAASKLAEEVERLRSLIDQTADGALLPDCKDLYCPKCAAKTRVVRHRACCDECRMAHILSDCYSTPEAMTNQLI